MTIKIISEGGFCPVQIEGTVDGLPFYFRARGSAWSLSIADTATGDPLDSGWYYTQSYSDLPFSAGWMTLAEARTFLEQAVLIWRTQNTF